MPKDTFISRVSSTAVDTPVFVASLTLNTLGLLMPIVLLQVFERVIPFQSGSTLMMLTLALVISAIFELALRICRSVLLSASAEDGALANHRQFLAKTLTADTAEYAKTPVAVHLERSAALGSLRDHASGNNQTLAIDLPFTAVFILFIGLIGGLLALVPILGLITVLAFSASIKLLQRDLFKGRKTLDERRYGFLSEVFGSMGVVKANAMEHQMTRRYERLEEQTVASSHRLIKFSGVTQNFGAIFSQLSVSALGLFGAYLVINSYIGVAELAACMMLNGRVMQPLLKLMTFWVQSESIATSKAKLNEINTIKQSHQRDDLDWSVTGEIQVSRVAAFRPNQHDIAFNHVSCIVPPGSIAHIDCADNWSAATFFGYVSGQSTPDFGTLHIDGHPATAMLSKRGANGLITLEDTPSIFEGTLLDNLSAFGDAEQVARAKAFADKLGLGKRINRLPNGYNTMLDATSLFQKDEANCQLIALVRALTLRPRILLMNEPTAVLDAPERDALCTCLTGLSQRPTILVASPDPRFRKIADMTIDLRPQSVVAAMRDWTEDEAQETDSDASPRKGVA
ncbi:ABC transporter transmembrane domain-containing protein [Gymnodinialimonas sp. 2305UL16-5]|uniref:ABC transporter transmembrane domain-containing protein n=1 Tax=Gymnodinialimonas mytili TaxID=3126503 RepID=UPI0030AAEAB2